MATAAIAVDILYYIILRYTRFLISGDGTYAVIRAI